MEIFLWILFAVFIALYFWVDKVFLSQPIFNHPELFWNPVVSKTLTIAPPLGLTAIAAVSFVFTTSGWWFLGAVVPTIVYFASKPAVKAGREDAEAVITRGKFNTCMDIVESSRLTLVEQQEIAEGFAGFTEKFAEFARSTLPEHCHKNYMSFIDPKSLRLEAENLFSEARTNSKASDSYWRRVGLAQELAGYYLLSHSWENQSLPRNTSRNPNAFVNSSPIVSAEITGRLSEFLGKHELTLSK